MTTRNYQMEIPAQISAWALAAIQAANEVDAGVYNTKRLSDAFTSVEVATAALSAAQAQVAQISADPRITRSVKIEQCTAIAKKAADDATKALDELSTVQEIIAKKLDDALAVKKPSVDPAILVDKKAEIKELLIAKSGRNATDLLNQMGKMLSAALDSGDTLKAWIVATQLEDFAEARGVTPSAWAHMRANVLGAHAGNGKAVPGSKLYAVLCGGGEGTLAGYLTYVKAKVQWAAEQLDQHIKSASVYWQDGLKGR